MTTSQTKLWLKKHFKPETKSYYLLNRDQLKTQYDTENVFFKFDEDCSGTLEANEIF